MDKLRGRAEKLLQGSLAPGEKVIGQLTGSFASQALVLTDQRALIIKVGFQAGQTLGGKVTSFEYRNITSVEVRASMLSGSFEIAAGGVQGAEGSYYGSGKNGAFKHPNIVPIQKKQLPAFQAAAKEIRRRIAEAQMPIAATAPATPPTAEPGVLIQIKMLAELHEAGILDDEEFSTKKQELLARV